MAVVENVEGRQKLLESGRDRSACAGQRLVGTQERLQRPATEETVWTEPHWLFPVSI